MNENILKIFFGSQHERDIKSLLPALQRINGLEKWARSLPAEEYPLQTNRLKERYQAGETIDALLPEAFALVREAAPTVYVVQQEFFSGWGHFASFLSNVQTGLQDSPFDL